MTNPDKKPKTVFNKSADNYIKDPADVARALAAIKARQNTQRDEKAAAAAQEQQKIFAGYLRNLEPMFGILENLPRDKNNMEFFIRRDLTPEKIAADGTKGAHINIWLIYGRHRTAPATSAVPDTHAVTFEIKAKDKQADVIEKSPARLRIALGTKPVLHITVAPGKTGDVIQSTVYQERYVRDKEQGTAANRRGDFVEQPDIKAQEEHPHLRDTLRVVYDWVKEAVPERTEEIRKALAVLESATLQDDVKVSRPLKLRRPPPQ